MAGRQRVIIDNDFSGDPDGLLQLVHHLLSPSVEIRALIGSHLRPGDPFDPSESTADNACGRIHAVLTALGVDAPAPVVAGSNSPLPDMRTPLRSAAATAIVAEALADDPRPLFLCCGAGLTEVASAWLMVRDCAIANDDNPARLAAPVAAVAAMKSLRCIFMVCSSS